MIPSGVARRVVAPLAWLVVLLPPAVVWAVTDAVETAAPLVPADRALRLEADVDASYDGDLEVPLRYRNPITDQAVAVVVPVHRDELRPDPGTRTEVLVDRHDPDAVMVEGDREPLSWRLAEYAWLPLVPVAVAAARLLFLRRVRRLLARDAPSFAMLAHVTESRVGPQRLVHLYPLDAPTGSRPLCTVAVLPRRHGVPRGRVLPVEVKGSPRPFGLVVVRIGERVLWPTGPARTAGRVSRPARLAEPAPPAVQGAEAPPVAGLLDPAALVLGLVAALGFALFVVGATLVGAHARADRIDGGTPVVVEAVSALPFDTVLRVRYTDAGGTVREATATPEWPEAYTTGRRYPAVLVGTGDGRVELLAEGYDRVEPVVWGALVPLVAAALLVRQRIYTSPRGRGRPAPRPNTDGAQSVSRNGPRHRAPGVPATGPAALTDVGAAASTALVAALVAAGLWVITADAWTKTENLLVRGVRTSGTVTDVTTGRSSSVEAEYRTRDGRSMRESTVNFTGAYEIGDPIDVVYDPLHPERMEAADWGADHGTSYVLGSMAGVATAVAVVCGGAATFLRLRRRRSGRGRADGTNGR